MKQKMRFKSKEKSAVPKRLLKKKPETKPGKNAAFENGG